jgi:hypothetical protein
MLALVVNRTPLAWKWMAGILAQERESQGGGGNANPPITEDVAVAAAVARLQLSADAYDAIDAQCTVLPGVLVLFALIVLASGAVKDDQGCTSVRSFPHASLGLRAPDVGSNRVPPPRGVLPFSDCPPPPP